MIARRLARVVLSLSLLAAAACASRPPARAFAPAAPADAADAERALDEAVRRADALPASRLLYDAKIGSRGSPTVPGTLAVTYDGRALRRASLTGPFGARVAEYDAGTVTGEDRTALVVDPAALRAVLAGAWPGKPASIRGCDGNDCLAEYDGRVRASAVVDRAAARLVSLTIEGDSGRLDVDYSGKADPWPEKIAARDERSGRSLKLSLVAVEPAATATPAPEPPR